MLPNLFMSIGKTLELEVFLCIDFSIYKKKALELEVA